MIRRISSVATAAIVTFSAAGAWAQAAPGGFGTSGQFVIGAERMFGFVSSHQKEEVDATGNTETDSITRFDLLAFHSVSPYTQPRIGLDFFVIDRLSIGGSLAFVSSGGEHESEEAGQSTTRDLPSTTGFLFAPRVGYALMFNDTIGFWPRAGFSYYSVSTDNDQGAVSSEDSENGLALTLEGLFMITPMPHFGFTVGPTLDLGLTGGRDTEPGGGVPTIERDKNITDIGIWAGLAVWF